MFIWAGHIKHMCECVVVTWAGLAYFAPSVNWHSRLTTLYQNWSTIHFFAHMQAVVVQGQVRKNILGANEMLRAVNDWTEAVKVEDDALLVKMCCTRINKANGLGGQRTVTWQAQGSLILNTPDEDANAIFVDEILFVLCGTINRVATGKCSSIAWLACQETSETFTDCALRSVKSGDWFDAEINSNEALELNRRCMKVKCSSS